MSTATQQKIIDGDGHVVEDIASILKYMPEEYVGRSFSEARGKNPFPPIVPCHRVVAAGAKSGGFSADGGVATKLRMLAIEGAQVEGTLPLFDRPAASPQTAAGASSPRSSSR